MRTSPVVALRKAILACLGADSDLQSWIGANGVFDVPPRGVEPPYVFFSEALSRDWSTALDEGVEQFLTLCVVSEAKGTLEALSVAERVVSLLNEAALTLENHRLIDLRFVRSETLREQNGRFARVNLRFRATTEYL